MFQGTVRSEQEENAVVPEAIAEVFLVGKPLHRLLCQGHGGILSSNVLNTRERVVLACCGENLIEDKVLPPLIFEINFFV